MATASAIRMIGERETSWTRAELVKSALDLGLKGVTAEGVEARMQRLLEGGQVLAGKSTRIDGVPDRYTTPEHRMIERSTLDNVARGNQRLALVMMTRVRDDITIVTNDKDRLLSQIERNPGDKTSALETLGEKQVDEGKGKRTSAEFSPKIPEHLRAGRDSLAPLPNVARDSLRSVPQIDLPERSIERSR
ncbi:hypothetical protein [Blastomonas sp. UPD001]|uniref:hypothetical protein n=1 Tax=Blastomonas sp. UPD001 TaxID=2217673 RepID=UPI0018E5467B|nr:hypothetical protein [Blastomonas sp. UPD001]